MTRVKLTRGGQISVPAEIRKRWDARVLDVEDHGDHVVVRPAADDSLQGLRGIFKGGLSSAEHRRLSRIEEQEAEDRRDRERRRRARP
jgi:bifunctional DNA-binding transcriptional regulator/antitoxin component of YhaV-PrlF toxin-antitoxin module